MVGEQITERGIGNGISILVFGGIVAGLPHAIIETVEQARQGQNASFSSSTNRCYCFLQ